MSAAAGRHGSHGRLFVLSGPSAVGKSTVLARLRKALPELYFSVSATTRQPRPGEVDGLAYHFVDRDEFTAMVASGEMLEWAEFAGNLYGTPRGPVADQRAAGRDVLLEIDVQGARQVRAATGSGTPDAAVLIFLAPPTFEELARRLNGRGTESVEIRQARLDAAGAELAAEPEFDHTVVNRRVAEATATLVDLLL
ncbi:MAG: guanylate kinase [Actinomycetota bacterium]|nr:guanylate kinase [Actinomycetota bacterium]